ncbi:MAG: rod shape-determining protein MreC [Rickettsiales bacterium]
MNIIIYIFLLIILIFFPMPASTNFSYYFFMKYIALSKNSSIQENTKENLQMQIYALKKELEFAKQTIQNQLIIINNAIVIKKEENINSFNKKEENINANQSANIYNNNKSFKLNDKNSNLNIINKDIVNKDNNDIKKLEIYAGILIYTDSFLKDKLIYLYTNFLDKIKQGDYIIYNKELIGIVENKNNNFAYVKLISNENSNIPVINVRNRDRYIATGFSNNVNDNLNKIYLKYVDKQNSPQKGDILILDFEDFDTVGPIIVGAINKVKDKFVIAEQSSIINKAKYVLIISK